MNQENDERLLDLLCKQAVYGLTKDEMVELSELEQTRQIDVDRESLEKTAAAVAVSSVRRNEVLPDHLKAKILSQANEFFEREYAEKEPSPRDVIADKKPAMPIWGWLGWAAAAVAAIILVLNIYQNSGRRDDLSNVRSTPTPEILTATQSRDRLLASAGDVVTADWGKGNVAGLEIAGDVVWSDSKQEGYMRFRNLPKNDVNVYTYQLWIFDETQDPKTPIDGGIFDVNADGEIVIPIDAKLRARGAKAFAITMEKPGGVMVSGRKQLVSLAPVKPSSI